MINLTINPGTGTPCPAAHTIVTACVVSQYSASVNVANSSGDITFYSIRIDRVDCATGAVIGGPLYVGGQVAVEGPKKLTALALNDLVINGSTGYFVGKCNTCYRVEVTIGNDCGSSSDFSFIRIAACLDGGSGDRESTDAEPRAKLEGIHLAPNPAEESIRFLSPEMDRLPEGLRLVIFNSLGDVMLRMEHLALDTPISIGTLPNGLYAYRLETTEGAISGQFLKQ